MGRLVIKSASQAARLIRGPLADKSWRLDGRMIGRRTSRDDDDGDDGDGEADADQTLAAATNEFSMFILGRKLAPDGPNRSGRLRAVGRNPSPDGPAICRHLSRWNRQPAGRRGARGFARGEPDSVSNAASISLRRVTSGWTMMSQFGLVLFAVSPALVWPSCRPTDGVYRSPSFIREQHEARTRSLGSVLFTC